MIAARVGQGLPILTHTEPICIVRDAPAKSGARIGVRKSTKEHSRSTRFFCANPTYLPVFYGWVVGGIVRCAGFLCCRYANSNNPATIPDIGVSAGGPEQRGSLFMANYRIAILSGSGALLRTLKIHSYQTITATSYTAARTIAANQNAVVIGWGTAV